MSAAAAANTYFTKVHPDEQSILFRDLGDSKQFMTLKGLDSGMDIEKLKVLAFEHGNLVCLIENESLQKVFEKENSQQLICQFYLGADKYFFKARFKIQKMNLFISVPYELFKLQRRSHYRIKVPDDFAAHLILKNVKGLPVQLKILDLSGGGCRVKVTQLEDFVINQKYQAHLAFKKADSIYLEIEFKRLSGPNLERTFTEGGVEFTSITEKNRNKIVGMVMDLYKEYII